MNGERHSLTGCVSVARSSSVRATANETVIPDAPTASSLSSTGTLSHRDVVMMTPAITPPAVVPRQVRHRHYGCRTAHRRSFARSAVAMWTLRDGVTDASSAWPPIESRHRLASSRNCGPGFRSVVRDRARRARELGLGPVRPSLVPATRQACPLPYLQRRAISVARREPLDPPPPGIRRIAGPASSSVALSSSRSLQRAVFRVSAIRSGWRGW